MLSNTRQHIIKGMKYMSRGDLRPAVKHFEAGVRCGDGSNLERDVAAWWMFNVAKYKREWKKRRFGNANLYWYDEDNNGQAWSDVEIAVVLMTPDTLKLNSYLVKFLGRSFEAIRFQRRYADGHPLKSWRNERGDRYTRFTQCRNVKNKIGV